MEEVERRREKKLATVEKKEDEKEVNNERIEIRQEATLKAIQEVRHELKNRKVKSDGKRDDDMKNSEYKEDGKKPESKVAMAAARRDKTEELVAEAELLNVPFGLAGEIFRPFWPG